MKVTDKPNPRSRRPNRVGEPTAGAVPRAGSKIASVITMLSREKGASVQEIMVATGWQPHTTRAALTGLRKRGFAIERTQEERGKKIATIYRIVGT